MSEAATREDSRAGVRRIWLNGALSILVILTLLAGAFIIGERQRRQTLFERSIGRLADRIHLGHPADGPRNVGMSGSGSEGNGLWSMTQLAVGSSSEGYLEATIEGAWTGDGWKVVEAAVRYREPGVSDGWTHEYDVTELVAAMGPKDDLFVPSFEVFTAQEE